MTENTEQAFFTKKHARLANIAQLAKIIAWIYLVVGLLNGATGVASNIKTIVPNIIETFKTDSQIISNFDRINLIIPFISSTIKFILLPFLYWLVLMAISAGLNMILETDLNYRGAAEDGEEPAEGGKPKAMRAIVTETARVLKSTFHKKSTGPAAEDDPDLKFIEGNQPVFYDPKQVLWLDKWLGIAAIVSISRYILNTLLMMDTSQQVFLSFFRNADGMSILVWIGTILFSLLSLGSQFLFIFFSLITLGALLKVLMEMEFHSRGVEE